MRVQASAAVFRPLRLNFAQVCIWCERRWCTSAECAVRHERSLWAVCDTCEGSMLEPDTERACSCLFGVLEAREACARAAVARYSQPSVESVRVQRDEARFVVVAR